jgi:hypothetical protein
MLGVSHATFHRITKEPRQKLKNLLDKSANAHTSLGLGQLFDEI